MSSAGATTDSDSATLLDADAVARVVKRLGLEIVEQTGGTERLALIGVRRGGVPLAKRIADAIAQAEGKSVPVGTVDIALYRDDAATALPDPKIGPSDVRFDVSGMDVVIVDDVLQTGRTIRAAIDCLLDYGRPRRVWLAVLCDRGGRELPIAADFVGRVLDVERTVKIDVVLEGPGEDRQRTNADLTRTAGAPMSERRFSHRHLTGIEGLTADDVLHVLDTSEAFYEVSRRPVRKVPTLRGKTILNLFYEASTRTRTSFELAGKRLSADVVNISASQSSVSKGESLYDTVKTLEAMRPDVVVLRHDASGASEYVAKRINASVVNAGDGQHEHPTQALLDAFTIRRHKGRLEGLVVTICGDVMHSRVARSNALLLRLFGTEVRVVAPRTLMPPAMEQYGVKVFDALEPALEGADVVMVLRIQRERLQGALLPSMREYARTFGIGTRTLAYAKADALVMHPGPMNRGVEISSEVADGAQSAVLEQVEAGVAVRMAVLYLLAAEPGERAGG